jgi:hypothetical protein
MTTYAYGKSLSTVIIGRFAVAGQLARRVPGTGSLRRSRSNQITTEAQRHRETNETGKEFGPERIESEARQLLASVFLKLIYLWASVSLW